MFTNGKIIDRIKSDDGAAGSTETIMLVAVAVFLVLAIYRFIVKPITDKSKDIGKAIESM